MHCTPINRSKMHPDIAEKISRTSVEPYYSGYLCSGVPGYEEIEDEDGTVLVQVDYDFPSLASSLGWSPLSVQRSARHGKRYTGPVRFNKEPCVTACLHPSTDGTVDCRECGCTAGDFIAGAARFLDNF